MAIPYKPAKWDYLLTVSCGFDETVEGFKRKIDLQGNDAENGIIGAEFLTAPAMTAIPELGISDAPARKMIVLLFKNVKKDHVEKIAAQCALVDPQPLITSQPKSHQTQRYPYWL